MTMMPIVGQETWANAGVAKTAQRSHKKKVPDVFRPDFS